MAQSIKNLFCALATGYILFVFSERIFWTVWRPGDSLTDLAITWLAYSAIAYLFLVVVSSSKADDFWSVFLAGATYGWLVEGGLADTLYGTQPSAPFPVSISVTGLSWHALISVMLGWWATGWAVASSRVLHLVWISIAVGIFWGMWGMFPRQETPPILTSPAAFFVNALLLSLGLMVAWWVNFRAAVDEFQPGWIGVLLSTFFVTLFYVGHVLRLGIFAMVVFPAVLSLALVPLYRHHRIRKLSAAASFCKSYPSPWRLAVLGLIPITATLVYASAAAFGMDRLLIPLIVYLVTGLAGFLLFLIAMVMTMRRPTARDEAQCPADTTCYNMAAIAANEPATEKS